MQQDRLAIIRATLGRCRGLHARQQAEIASHALMEAGLPGTTELELTEIGAEDATARYLTAQQLGRTARCEPKELPASEEDWPETASAEESPASVMKMSARPVCNACTQASLSLYRVMLISCVPAALHLSL